jgi:hypothetical protein
MGKKLKLKLEDLKVQSFVTVSEEQLNKIKAGADQNTCVSACPPCSAESCTPREGTITCDC